MYFYLFCRNWKTWEKMNNWPEMNMDQVEEDENKKKSSGPIHSPHSATQSPAYPHSQALMPTAHFA